MIKFSQAPTQRAPLTPDALATRQRMAQSLMQEGSSTAPVQHRTQGLARVAQAALGAYENNGVATQMRDREAYDEKQSTARRMAERVAAMDDKKAWDEYQRNRAPTEAEKLDLDYKRAQINALNQKASGAVDDRRIEQLLQLGINPGSAEGQAFLLNGKLPAAAYEQIAQRQRRAATAPKIAEGLQNLNNMTDTYNDAAFENSVGPFQGSNPDGLVNGALINTARGLGEAWNTIEGGNATPNEVRNNIVGATEALAAAIKPLIRAPGEGVWTDADQARLVSVVGDLSQSSNKAEFKRRLNAVRDRIKSNFELDIPFDSFNVAPGATLQKRGAQPFLDRGGPPAAGGFKYIGTAP